MALVPFKNKASVVIIGCGIIGASIAYNLAKQGTQNVVVLDKSKAGSGSTAASLGGFRHQFSNELSIRLSLESIREIERFKETIGYDPLVKHDGYLFIATSQSSIRQLEKNRTLQRSLGVSVDFLAPYELSSKFPFYSFDGFLGGNLCMEDGHASTFAVLQGYVSRAKELDVTIYEEMEVTGIQRETSKVTGVKTNQGTIESDKVVIAAGAYSGLVGGLASVSIPVSPYPRKILVTKNFSGGVPDEVPLIVDVDSSLSIGREGKGMIIADNPLPESSFDLSFPNAKDDQLIAKAIARVPALARATIGYANQGLYELTPDSNPIVSAIPQVEGLYCCAGFAGHGFMHSPAIGKIMGEIILGKQTHLDVSTFSIERFKTTTPKEDLVI